MADPALTPPGPTSPRLCRCLLGGLELFNADREQAAGLLRAQVTLKSGRWPRAGQAQRRPCAALLASNLELKVPRLVVGGLDDVAWAGERVQPPPMGSGRHWAVADAPGEYVLC
jgi:hypothetical protein